MAVAGQIRTREAPRRTALGPPVVRVPGGRYVWRESERPGPFRAVLRLLGRLASLALMLAAVAAVGCLVAVAAGPRFGWFRIETVLSGSMRPTFSPGDLIIVTPEATRAVRVGQVITYSIPIGDRHVESHRVARILRHGNEPIIVTKGDANPTPDPWHAQLHGGTAWTVRTVVPRVGAVITWLRSPTAHLLTVIVVPLCLAASWLVLIWRRPDPA
jgi:signal peptidase I